MHLTNSRPGVVENISHEDEIRSLPSVLSLHLEAAVGDAIAKTVDIRTDSGYVLLQHDDDAVVQMDFDRIVQLQHTIYEVSQQPPQSQPQPPQSQSQSEQSQLQAEQSQPQQERMTASTMTPPSPQSNFVATDHNHNIINNNGEVYAPLGTAGVSGQVVGQLNQVINRLNQVVKTVNWQSIATSSRQGLMVIGSVLSRMITGPAGAKIIRILARAPLLAACYLAIAYGFGLLVPLL